MRVMRTDDTETSRRVAARLTEDGHVVTDACLPDRSEPTSCRGLHDGCCPLSEDPDVAISGEDGTGMLHASPGVVCAHRASVPVVTVGRHDADHVDLGPAIARRAGRGDGLVALAIDEALQRYVDHHGIGAASVRLVRTGESERIEATVEPGVSRRQRSDLAVRLLAAAEATGRRARRRDVAVLTRAEPG